MGRHDSMVTQLWYRLGTWRHVQSRDVPSQPARGAGAMPTTSGGASRETLRPTSRFSGMGSMSQGPTGPGAGVNRTQSGSRRRSGGIVTGTATTVTASGAKSARSYANCSHRLGLTIHPGWATTPVMRQCMSASVCGVVKRRRTPVWIALGQRRIGPTTMMISTKEWAPQRCSRIPLTSNTIHLAARCATGGLISGGDA